VSHLDRRRHTRKGIAHETHQVTFEARPALPGFTLKALRELASLDVGMDTEDACDVLARVGPTDLVDRVTSVITEEWMYIPKPRVVGVEDEGSDEEEDS
jgi:hypothetical protein